ncbi:MAG: ATP-grasp domain-containing protein [Planctomycetota bacterium]|jgi:succinyl-CoA synthetase beta subunit
MARLHEYQGKALLAESGITVPDGGPVATPPAAGQMAAQLGGRVVLKAQAWITGRAAQGGIKFADTPQDAEAAAAELLAMTLGHFPVTEVLVERALDISDELFLSLAIDDEAQAPVMLLEAQGGTGIEDRAEAVQRLPVDMSTGIDGQMLRTALHASPVAPQRHDEVVAVAEKVVNLARRIEARSLEINPLVITADGKVVAADCRVTIDDYAVFRHPELGIEIARELDHPATDLERTAYRVEQADHRGTFFFARLPAGQHADARKLIGFHGAGGGGSMMSMDAISRLGFQPANYCDTSGNPSAAKVYRAARIILTQPQLVGYFGSGSGVASQEQYHSAYGLAKAFCEVELSIPAVIRLGGNSEDRAVEILQDACRDLPGRVEGYRKDDTPAFIAERFAKLVEESKGATWTPRPRTVPGFVGGVEGGGGSYHFPINGGTVWIDGDRCDAETTAFVVEQSQGLLREADGKPELAVGEQDVAGRDSELVALEIECRRAGRPVVFVDLPLEGLDEHG